MTLKLENYDGVGVFSVKGDLVTEMADDLRERIDDLIERKDVVDFVFDMGGCEFIDSAGLETLTWLQGRCDELFGRLKLVEPAENARKILEITQLLPRFDVSSELNTAIKSLR
ncbi:MAG: STAS domain-containing protein [Planctomycetota bacterium]